MTLSRLIATGLGRLAARLEIEGLSIQPVSDPGMEREAYRTARARERVPAVTGFTPASYLLRSASTVLQGGADMSGAVLFKYDTAVAATQMLMEQFEAAAGWSVFVSSGGQVMSGIRGGGSTNYAQITTVLVPGNVYCFAWSWDGTNHRGACVGVNGFEEAINETPGLTYAQPGSAASGIGAYAGGSSPAVGASILGIAWADATSQSESALLALCNAAIRRGTLRADDLTGCTNLWLAHDLGTDLVGNVDFTEQGTLTKVYVEIGDELTGAFPGNAHLITDQVGGGAKCTATPWPASLGFEDGPPNQSVRGARTFDGAIYAWGQGDATQLAALQSESTLTLWVRADAAPATRYQLFAFGPDTTAADSSSANNAACILSVLSSGYLEAFWESGSGTNHTFTQSSGTAFAFDGEWHRIDVVRSSSGTALAFYLDGAAVASTTGLTAPTGGGSPPAMVLGNEFTGTSYVLDGALWGVMLRDVALTAEAIAAEYADGPAEAPNSDVVGFWCVGDNEPARVHCLDLFTGQGAGLRLEESVNIPEASLESRGLTLRLLETDAEDVSQALARRPSLTRYLATTAEATDTTLELVSADGLAAGDVLHVGTECIIVGAVDGTTITHCERGARGTVARKLWTDDDVTGRTAQLSLTDEPERVRGRRIKLYLYGDGDDLQGDGGNAGAPVWRSVATMEPRLTDSGTVWGIIGGSIASLLSTKIGGELEVPFEARGIYYPWNAPLYVRVGEMGGASPVWHEAGFTGFFETQAAFIAALNAWLEAFVSDGGYSAVFAIRAEERGPEWGFTVTWGASTTSVAFQTYSMTDGVCERNSDNFILSSGVPVGTYAPSSGEILTVPWTIEPAGIVGARTVPRGTWGSPPITVPYGDPAEWPYAASSAPEDRIYITRTVNEDWSAITVEWPAGGERIHRIGSGGYGVADGYIELGRAPLTGVGDTWTGDVYTSLRRPVIRATRDLTEGTIAQLRDALVAESVENSARGLMGFITGEDLADWTEIAAATYRFPWHRRIWTLAGSADVLELLQAEWRLLGVYPITDSQGKIALRQIAIPNASQGGFTAIDEEIISVGWSSMVRGSQTVNRWRLQTGYRPVEDEWTGTPLEAVNSASLVLDNMDRGLEVAPRSIGRGEENITADDLAIAALPVVSMFGFPYDLVEVNVSWKLFLTRLGDFVSFSAAEHLPSRSTGRRPMGTVAGVVVGRSWELGQPHGKLTLYLSSLNVAGYSPTARVVGTANVSGNTWNLSVNATMYVPTDADGDPVARVEDYFVVGDKVRIVEFDSESPSVVTGTVAATSLGIIRVDFDATFTPGSATWELCYQPITAATIGQKIYAAIADSGARLDGGEARTYAP